MIFEIIWILWKMILWKCGKCDFLNFSYVITAWGWPASCPCWSNSWNKKRKRLIKASKSSWLILVAATSVTEPILVTWNCWVWFLSRLFCLYSMLEIKSTHCKKISYYVQKFNFQKKWQNCKFEFWDKIFVIMNHWFLLEFEISRQKI